MLLRLLLIFTLLPVLELVVILEVGKRAGTSYTIGLILLTGFIGAVLARREGLGVLLRFRSSVARGEMPTGTLGEAASVLAGGLLLLTPGFITDGIGFMLLIPVTRRMFLSWAYRRLRHWVQIRYWQDRRDREW